jgi:hypothetical protein
MLHNLAEYLWRHVGKSGPSWRALFITGLTADSFGRTLLKVGGNVAEKHVTQAGYLLVSVLMQVTQEPPTASTNASGSIP